MKSRTGVTQHQQTGLPGSALVAASLLIAILIFTAYIPAIRGGFIWDDDAHVTKPELRSLQGLYRIWFDVGATQQYYPLLHTAFWIQHKLWGDSPLGYHVVNIAMHASASILVLMVMRRLLILGKVFAGDEAAILTAALFALHPVQVESVAWITELKNTLSTVFYLSALLLYLRFDQTRRAGTYWIALILFVLGLMTKTVIATLPAAILVIVWWAHGRLSWKRDVVPMLPWFLLGAISGLFTAWVEHELIGAKGGAFDLSLVQRFLLAGRVFWFYLYKLVWPLDLIFIYPRWSVNAATWWQWLFPLALIAMFIILWAYSRVRKGPLAATLFYVGSLFPVLGFINVYPFRYSFVADHFQYLASLGVFALIGAALTTTVLVGVPSALRRALILIIPLSLGALTFQQCQMYANAETLYLKTIERNPYCWMAHNNLGNCYFETNRLQDSVSHLHRAIDINPEFAEAHYNLANILVKTDQIDEAERQFEMAITLWPRYVEAHVNLASLLQSRGRVAESTTHLMAALEIDPGHAIAHFNLANALARQGRTAEAIQHYTAARQIRPDLRPPPGYESP